MPFVIQRSFQLAHGKNAANNDDVDNDGDSIGTRSIFYLNDEALN